MFVRVADGDLVCVPRDLRHLTTYVLLEQEDWFEHEIGFVRRCLEPNQRALDVGASYGTYGLAMARAVGPGGRVWCFEPGGATRGLLERSVARNGLTQVTVVPAAVAAVAGRGHLQLDASSELNRLVVAPIGATEAIAVTTLDREQEAQRWGVIDFVKLDVEGAELDVLRGGARFFAEQSPLVMFELRHGGTTNVGLLAAFRERGYGLYNVIGPDRMLVPFDPASPLDPMALNLFACKPDRAATLAERGLLAQGAPILPAAAPAAAMDGIGGTPFASLFAAAPAPSDAAGLRYREALADYAAWRDVTGSPAVRAARLLRALATLRDLAARASSFARVATLARVAGEAGAPGEAALAAGRLIGAGDSGAFNLDEPFWPPSARFDTVAPGDQPAIWALAAAIEQHERRRAFSSYFARDSLGMVEWVQQTPFHGAELERRCQLIRMATGRQAAPQQTPSLDGRNPEYWSGAPIT